MATVSHNRPPLESTPPINNVPVRQLIAQITSLEMWRVDLWVATPGSEVYGLPTDAVASFVGDHLDALRAELRQREALEAGR